MNYHKETCFLMKNRIEFDPTVLELRCNRERHTQTEIDVKHITTPLFPSGIKTDSKTSNDSNYVFLFSLKEFNENKNT